MRLQPCCFGLIQKRSEVTDDAMHQNPSHMDSVVEPSAGGSWRAELTFEPDGGAVGGSQRLGVIPLNAEIILKISFCVIQS